MTATLEMPKQINSISEAKAHFSAIVDEASEGQTFVICRAGRPLVVVSRYRVKAPKRRPNSLPCVSALDRADVLEERQWQMDCVRTRLLHHNDLSWHLEYPPLAWRIQSIRLGLDLSSCKFDFRNVADYICRNDGL